MAVTLSYPKPRDTISKHISIARANTTAAVMAWLPKHAIPTGYFIMGQVASDATTSASISVGTTATSNELIATYDVKTAATGEGFNVAGAAAVGPTLGANLTVDTPVYAKYTSSGAETTGGPWIVRIDYFMPGPGETVAS
jgi:hypothetical protein